MFRMCYEDGGNFVLKPRCEHCNGDIVVPQLGQCLWYMGDLDEPTADIEGRVFFLHRACAEDFRKGYAALNLNNWHGATLGYILEHLSRYALQQDVIWIPQPRQQ